MSSEPVDPGKAPRQDDIDAKLLFQAVPHAVLAFDPAGRCTACNPAASRFLDRAGPQEVVGSPLEELLRAAEAPDWFEEVVRTGCGLHLETVTLLRPHGNAAAACWAEAVRRDDRVVGAAVVLIDLTEHNADIEQRLRFGTSTPHETQKLESLAALTSGIALDFNNLLVGVLAHTGLAMSSLEDGSTAREHIEQIEVTALRAADLSKQLLAISGKANLATRPLNLGMLLKEIGRLLRAAVGDAIELEFNLTSQLPLIEGDPNQIRQIMMNLVLNAAEAIGDRGHVSIGTGIVDVDADYPEGEFLPDKLEFGRYIYVTVTDDGRGFDEATLDKIFDPFFSTKSDGHGLGLAAVLSIIKGHRGAIQVQSAVGRGSTFKVYFPCSDKKDRLPAHELHDGQIFAKTGTVLVVDDDDTVREVTKEILISAGYGVLTARDGLEGVRLVDEHRYEIALVVLDMRMPRMGGAEAFQKMREINRSLPILLASGYDPQEAATHLAEQHPASFLHKPYSPQELTDQVRRLLDAPRG